MNAADGEAFDAWRHALREAAAPYGRVESHEIEAAVDGAAAYCGERLRGRWVSGDVLRAVFLRACAAAGGEACRLIVRREAAALNPRLRESEFDAFPAPLLAHLAAGLVRLRDREPGGWTCSCRWDRLLAADPPIAELAVSAVLRPFLREISPLWDGPRGRGGLLWVGLPAAEVSLASAVIEESRIVLQTLSAARGWKATPSVQRSIR
jgi:hypothetical protein